MKLPNCCYEVAEKNALTSLVLYLHTYTYIFRTGIEVVDQWEGHVSYRYRYILDLCPLYCVYRTHLDVDEPSFYDDIPFNSSKLLQLQHFFIYT